jgi:hypothetical protein
MRKILLGGVLALSIALTGCAAQDADPDAAGQSERPETEFDRYLAVLFGDDPDTDYEALSREYESAVAACMSDEGFEYIPVDYSQDMPESTGEDMGTVDWAAEHGYGFIESLEDTGGGVEEDGGFVDPNATYTEGLSEVELEAYNVALGGPVPSEEELADPDFDYEYNWETAGCYGQADHAVYGDTPAEDEANAALIEAFERVWTDAESSPEMKAIEAEWVACMAAAGHDGFSLQADASNAAWEAYVETAAEAATESEVKSLLEAEIDLAVADYTCQEEVDYQDAMTDIYNDQGQRFVDENRVELDAMVARAEQGE